MQAESNLSKSNSLGTAKKMDIELTTSRIPVLFDDLENLTGPMGRMFSRYNVLSCFVVFSWINIKYVDVGGHFGDEFTFACLQ